MVRNLVDMGDLDARWSAANLLFLEFGLSQHGTNAAAALSRPRQDAIGRSVMFRNGVRRERESKFRFGS